MKIHDIVSCESGHDVLCIRQNYKGAETMTRQKSLLVKREESEHDKEKQKYWERTGEGENNLKNCLGSSSIAKALISYRRELQNYKENYKINSKANEKYKLYFVVIFLLWY